MDKDTLYRFFSGDATQAEEEKVLSWVEACADNKDMFLKERQIFDAMLLHAGWESTVSAKSILPKWAKELLKVAAILLVVLGGSLFYIHQERVRVLSAVNSIKVPSGQHVNIKLPDGTVVCLNSNSELTYPAFFEGSKREVTLKGEAYFDVVHNEKMPFVVKTDKYNVEVLGTTFDVEAYPDKNEFTASLIRGKVKVVNTKDENDVIFLSPNEQVFTTNEGLATRTIPSLDSFTWREGILSFNGDSFDKIIEKIEKCYDVKVVINKYPEKGNELYGKVKISYGVDHVLKILEKTTLIKYSWGDDMKVIYIN